MPRACPFALLLALSGSLCAANWTSVKTGPFLVFSEESPRQTREHAAELEQFRFSLGELLGRHDLAIHPSLQVFFLSSPASNPNPTTTRTGGLALMQSPGPITSATREQLARILLDQNIGRMPPALERGLQTFLSTTEVHGAKVTWGAPPPPNLRDANWALVDWLVTNPETYSNMRVLFANLENNVEEGVAYRNALGKTRAEIEKEVEAYVQTGQFRTIDGPGRPLNPERDLGAHEVSPDDVTLHLADLLNSQSEQRYHALLNSGTHKAEAEEGLALLALRRKDLPAASDLLQRAIADGSKNAAAMVEYARIEPDTAKALATLEAAVIADPNSADAHFVLGEKLTDPVKQIQEWMLATKLAPRNANYWAALAEALVNRKQWVEASKAFHSAEQAAAMPEEREKMISARLAIEGERADFQEGEKRREKEAAEREILRLKDEARAELRAAEAKVNGNSSPADSANAVPWDQLDGAQALQIDGEIVRVECTGTLRRIVLRTPDGKLLKLNARAANSAIPLPCGVQKDHSVSVTYNAKSNPRTGVAGDAVSISAR